MKDKPDNQSQERLAHIKQAAKEAGLPECIKLPSSVKLAQIAAGFGNGAHPAAAVKQAVALFLRATVFIAKHDNAHALDVARACDDELAGQLSSAAMMVPFKRTYLLKPDDRQDEARRNLAEAGLSLRKAKSVLENLKQWHRFVHLGSFLRNRDIPVTWKGKPVLVWGIPTGSERSDDPTKLNEALKAKCRMVTRKEYDEQTEAIAKQNGWRDGDYEREWKQVLASITETRAAGRVVYHLPGHWLGELCAWKKSLKHTGGVKSRQTKKSTETA